MGRRLDLQELLEEAAGEGNEVYFQPPENIKMQYPCYVYHRDYTAKVHADNNPYRVTRRYELTVIDRNPDSPLVDRAEMLPMTSYVRHFEEDGLHHDIYEIYF